MLDSAIEPVRAPICTKCSAVDRHWFAVFEIEKLEGNEFCELHYPSELHEKPTEKRDWSKDRHDKIGQKLSELLSSGAVVRMKDVSVFGDIRISDKTLAGFDFDNCRFNGAFSVYDCTVLGTTLLKMCDIQAFIARGSTWCGPFSAVECAFDNVLIADCNFKGDTRFSKSAFQENLIVHKVVFDEYTSFRECEFSKNAVFDQTRFNGYSHFLKAKFDRLASFADVIFRSITTFDEAKFTGPARFAATTFRIAPTFFGSTVSGSVDLNDAEFCDKKSSFAYEAYRDLRLTLGKRNSGIDESKLYRLEQESLRNARRTGGGVFFPFLYGKFSAYGTSWLRPVAVFAVTFVCATAVYFFAIDTTVDLGKRFEAAIEYSLRQVFAPFSVWAKPDVVAQIGTPIVGPPTFVWLKLVAALQSVFTLLSIGLLTLALRWRFKKDS